MEKSAEGIEKELERNLEETFLDLVEGTREWYDNSSSRWGNTLLICKLLSFISSLVTLILAAALDKDYIAQEKWILVGAAVLSAAASELLTQFKVREMEELREEGHLEAEAIAAEVEQKLIELRDDQAKLSEFMDKIRARIAALDKKQHRGHVAIERKLAAHKQRAP